MTNLRFRKLGLLALFTLAFGHAQSLQEQIVAQERAELDSLKSGDLNAFAGFLSDDAVFVDSHGPAGKAEVVKNTAVFRLREYTMTGIRFVPLSADSGLIAYTLNENVASHGKEFSLIVQASALWMKRNGRWVCLFSQESATK
jgi:ketosteroid isomerase-like protein